MKKQKFYCVFHQNHTWDLLLVFSLKNHQTVWLKASIQATQNYKEKVSNMCAQWQSSAEESKMERNSFLIVFSPTFGLYPRQVQLSKGKTVWKIWTSLVVQWIKTCLPVQGTRVWSLVWEDFTYWGATKPVCHKYWEPVLWNPWVETTEPVCLEPVLCKRSLCTTMKSSPGCPQL